MFFQGSENYMPVAARDFQGSEPTSLDFSLVSGQGRRDACDTYRPEPSGQKPKVKLKMVLLVFHTEAGVHGVAQGVAEQVEGEDQ